MMSKVFFFLMFIIIGQRLSAQKDIVVCDSLTKKIIPDAYLTAIDNNAVQILSFSNGDGRIRKDTKHAGLDVCLSHISYLKKWIPRDFDQDTIFLVPANISLAAVMVENIKVNKSNIFGYYKSGKKQSLYAPTTATIFGTMIPIDTLIGKFKIQSILCEFEDLHLVEKRKSNCRVGIVFYLLRVVDNMPVMENLIDPIILNYTDLKENFKIEIPLSPVVINTGNIFVGAGLQDIECAGGESGFKNYYLPIKGNTTNHNWSYQYKTGRWKQLSSLFSGAMGISVKLGYHEK